MRPLLQVSGLDVTIGMHPILHDISFDVASGQVLGLVGESGAGKSMIGRTILNVLPQDARIGAGRVTFDEHDLFALAPRARRALLGRGLAMIPQDPMAALNPARRIEDQICDGLRLHLKASRRAALARARELLVQVQIREPDRVMRQYPHELSGGMRQRVLIAIAFSCNPKLIVADEPTTALDVTVQKQILRLIKLMQRDFGTALLFVSHDLGVIAKICDFVCVMKSGRIVEAAPVGELFAAPRHPYTQALFAATPRYDRPLDALPVGPTRLAPEPAIASSASGGERRRG